MGKRERRKSGGKVEGYRGSKVVSLESIRIGLGESTWIVAVVNPKHRKREGEVKRKRSKRGWDIVDSGQGPHYTTTLLDNILTAYAVNVRESHHLCSNQTLRKGLESCPWTEAILPTLLLEVLGKERWSNGKRVERWFYKFVQKKEKEKRKREKKLVPSFYYICVQLWFKKCY